MDPLALEYPMLTPYQYASNTPIVAIDLDGLEMAYPSAMNAGLNFLESKVGLKAMRVIKKLKLPLVL